MLERELLGRLLEFYSQCQIRGWCVIKNHGKEFLTIQSSELNFTHLPLNFSRYPRRCIISPRRSKANVEKLKSIIVSLDSSRLLSIESRYFRFILRLYAENGRCISEVSIWKFTLPWSDKLGGFGRS